MLLRNPNRAFPDCNSSLNKPMALKWCTEFEAAYKRCPIAFQFQRSNFKVTRGKKNRWFWSELISSALYYRIGVLLFFSRSSIKFQGYTWPKNRRCWPEFSEFTNGFEMMDKAWSDIEEVPCCFARCSLYQISRSRGTTNSWFWPELDVSGL